MLPRPSKTKLTAQRNLQIQQHNTKSQKMTDLVMTLMISKRAPKQIKTMILGTLTMASESQKLFQAHPL